MGFITQTQIQDLIKKVLDLETKVKVLEIKVTELTNIEDDLFNDLKNLELE